MGSNISRSKSSYFSKLTEEDKRSYPINIFFMLFPDFCNDKYDPVYIKNLNIILKIHSDNIGFQIIESMDKHGLLDSEIMSKYYVSASQVPQKRFEALKIIKDNKDVIFNGFGHSKLRNKCINRLCREIPGLSMSSAAGIVDSGLYSVTDITKVKDGKALIKILSKELDPERVGNVLEDTLISMNKVGYNTEKFGYTGKSIPRHSEKSDNPTAVDSSNVQSISGYRYGGFSETTFRIQCPKCDHSFRIHLIGTIDDNGCLKIERTNTNKNAIWYCPDCGVAIKVDKINTFLKNYMDEDS